MASGDWLTSEQHIAAAFGCGRADGVGFCIARANDGPAEAPGQAYGPPYGHAAQLLARKRRRGEPRRAPHRRAHLQPPTCIKLSPRFQKAAFF